MKPNTYFLALILLIGLVSCQTKEAEQTEEKTTTFVPETPLEKSIEAHGGIATWQSYKTLNFELVTGSGENERRESIMTHLHNRSEKISGADYTMGYDGENYWQKLDEGVKEKNVKFMINLQFYFFAMPFVLGDPGVNEESLGRQTMGDKEYVVVKATFDPGTGVAPEDQYILYLNPETYELEILLYSVTYFNSENATKYNALHYAEWQEVDGLKMPKTMVRHYWDADNNTLGDSRGEKRFENVKFGAEDADGQMFAMPEGGSVMEE